MDIQLDESNILLFKVFKIDSSSKIDINIFIELFLEDGPFENLLPNLVGCSVHNTFKQIFSVTFNNKTDQILIAKLLSNFLVPQTVKASNGTELQIQINRPQKSQHMITLYPVNHNIGEIHINQITKNWGKMESYKFGKHRRCPILLNNYLHLFFTDIKKQNIPDTFKINGKTVTILIQGEENILRCSYCKEKNHEIQSCPKKTHFKENQSYSQTNPKSYAARLSSSNVSKTTSSNPLRPPPRPQTLPKSNSFYTPLKQSSFFSQKSTTPPTSPKKLTLPSPIKSVPSSPTPSSTSESSTQSDSTAFEEANESIVLIPHNQPGSSLQIDDFPPLNPPKKTEETTTTTTTGKSKRKKNPNTPTNLNNEKKKNTNSTPEINK